MKIIAIISLTFYFGKGFGADLNFQRQLNPVHGLFVKPSEDGITGDLYVAATEDNGVNSQWLTDHPINFLTTSASTQSQAASTPVKYTSSLTTSTSPNEETVTSKKRAVITSPAVKYTYALPFPGPSEGSKFSPYPYAFYAPNMHKSDEEPQCQSDGLTATAGLPFPTPFPFHYYYPQMMTALSAAMNVLKEDDEDNGAKASKLAHPSWPAAYAYPYQYVMVDPASWSPSNSGTFVKVTTGAPDSE